MKSHSHTADTNQKHRLENNVQLDSLVYDDDGACLVSLCRMPFVDHFYELEDTFIVSLCFSISLWPASDGEHSSQHLVIILV